MAEQAGAELIDDDLDQDTEGLEPEGDQIDGKDQGDASEDDEDEVQVTFGDEVAPTSGEGRETSEFKRLRDHSREQAKRIAELERQVPQVKPIEIGEKPSLEGCEWDADKFEADLLAWNARKGEADKAQARRNEETQAQQEAWNAEIQRFSTGKAELKAKDFDIAEGVVQAALSEVQLAALVVGTTDPAKLVYALGKHPEKLKALAAITHPVKLAVAASKLESTMKFASSRRRAPEPEGIVRGGAPITQKVDKEEQRLEAEAGRTSDFSKLFAYRREKRKAS